METASSSRATTTGKKRSGRRSKRPGSAEDDLESAVLETLRAGVYLTAMVAR